MGSFLRVKNVGDKQRTIIYIDFDLGFGSCFVSVGVLDPMSLTLGCNLATCMVLELSGMGLMWEGRTL